MCVCVWGGGGRQDNDTAHVCLCCVFDARGAGETVRWAHGSCPALARADAQRWRALRAQHMPPPRAPAPATRRARSRGAGAVP
jgi:hypothetical protein